MAYTFYSAYIDGMAQSPQEDWQESYQQSANEYWDNTSTVAVVSGQKEINNTEYQNEDVQINSLINIKTGENFGDEYRSLIYRNYCEQNGWLGKYYQIDGNYWLVTNTNTRIGSVKTAVIRYCNNILKWYDDTNTLREYNCVYSNRLTGTSLDYGSEGVPQIEADGQILIQRNNDTDKIPFNQRFILDGHAFQVKQIDNHYSPTLMTIYLFETQIQSNDDLVNNIAGGQGEVNPTTTENMILPNIGKINLGQTIEFNVYNYVNGVANTDTFTVSISGVPETSYTLQIIDGNNFSITNVVSETSALNISCVNNTTNESVTKEITLGGVW